MRRCWPRADSMRAWSRANWRRASRRNERSDPRVQQPQVGPEPILAAVEIALVERLRHVGFRAAEAERPHVAAECFRVERRDPRLAEGRDLLLDDRGDRLLERMQQVTPYL